MTDRLAIQRVGEGFRIWGWVSFWTQTVLTVISFFMLGLGIAGLRQSPGSGGAFLFAIAGWVALGMGAYMAFQYPRRGRQLKLADEIARPSRAETIQLIRQNIFTNLVGLGLIIIGAEAFAGSLFFKASKLGFGLNILNTKPGDLIQIVDIFVVLANTHIIAAHTIGLTISLWLLNRVIR